MILKPLVDFALMTPVKAIYPHQVHREIDSQFEVVRIFYPISFPYKVSQNSELSRFLSGCSLLCKIIRG